ncbi:MAG: putative membrane protein [Nonlabens sp.]|jgi:uncharacterized membrane protein
MTKTRSVALWIFLTSIFSWLMFRIIFPYSSWEWDVDFLQTKQFIIHLDHYRISFYAHIFSSLVILVSGSFLFVDALLKNWPSAHRTLGKLYVALLLLVAAPSGFVMAFYANGGWMAKTSFLILTPLWWWFTYKGLQTARSGQFKAHRKWMMRSYALTLSAISLRLFQFILGYYFYINPKLQYILVSWTSWIFNLVAVELLIRNPTLLKSSLSTFLQRLRFGRRISP